MVIGGHYITNRYWQQLLLSAFVAINWNRKKDVNIFNWNSWKILGMNRNLFRWVDSFYGVIYFSWFYFSFFIIEENESKSKRKELDLQLLPFPKHSKFLSNVLLDFLSNQRKKQLVNAKCYSLNLYVWGCIMTRAQGLKKSQNLLLNFVAKVIIQTTEQFFGRFYTWMRRMSGEAVLVIQIYNQIK